MFQPIFISIHYNPKIKIEKEQIIMPKTRTEKIVHCAIAILLGEAKDAKELLNQLSSDERMLITDYPIYKLLAR
jgi:hypothetical protein